MPVPVGLPHAISSDSVRVGPYSVPKGHTLRLSPDEWSHAVVFRVASRLNANCSAVGPPYTFRMRVKFYSSEPNCLREEITR